MSLATSFGMQVSASKALPQGHVFPAARSQSSASRCRPARKMNITAAAGDAQHNADATTSKASEFKLPMGNRRNMLKMAGAALGVGSGLGLICPCCGPSPAKADEWGYGDVSGPGAWSGTCSNGQYQSPVNIPVQSITATSAFTPGEILGDFRFNYKKAETVAIFNTGHGTMQVNFASGNTCSIGYVNLELVQFHFHSPSEHAIDGSRSAMEVHLVHRNIMTGGLAVLGAMIEPRAVASNPCLRHALKYAPPKPRRIIDCPVRMDPMDLLPAPTDLGHRPFVHYTGSLTTPPCSESVEWFVFTDPIYCTERQILEFMKYVGNGKDYGRNSRPVQSLNQRPLDYHFFDGLSDYEM